MPATSRNLHFTTDELARRKQAVVAAMEARGLDAILLFRQESHYWLTGYDTFGYVHFQAMVLDADGRLTLLTRSADRLQARFTSIVEDVRIWVDRAGAEPERELAAILLERGLAGKRIGVEYEAYGLTAAKGKRLDAALAQTFALEDASFLVSELRAVKSDAEIAYVRRAAALADEALAAARARVAAGAFEGDVLADMHAAIARVLDAAGYGHARLNACGYSLGTTFAPSWMDWPMLHAGQGYEARPGNVFFCHMILFDEAAGLAMTLGRTALVGARGAEPLSRASLELVRA